MINCPKCGTAVRDEKAFCHYCGSPMDAAKAEREVPLPDFGATIIEPPRRVATPQQQPPPPRPTPEPRLQTPRPPVTEVQPASRATAPVSYPPAGVATPTPSGAPPPARQRTSSRKIGFGFVLLLLFLMFLAFVMAIVID